VTVPLKLQIELVPQPLWYKSLNKLLPRAEWDVLRRSIYPQYQHRCASCGAGKQMMYCHERWLYDDEHHVARLDGFEALCKRCHLVTHLGYAGVSGQSEGLMEHFCQVNGCDEATFHAHKDEAWVRWWQRSAFYAWRIDFGLYGAKLDARKVADAALVRQEDGTHLVNPDGPNRAIKAEPVMYAHWRELLRKYDKQRGR
jgi:hypothetical protein